MSVWGDEGYFVLAMECRLLARTPVLPEATLVGAFRPIEASKVAVCYARNKSTHEVAALLPAARVRKRRGRREFEKPVKSR